MPPYQGLEGFDDVYDDDEDWLAFPPRLAVVSFFDLWHETATASISKDPKMP